MAHGNKPKKIRVIKKAERELKTNQTLSISQTDASQQEQLDRYRFLMRELDKLKLLIRKPPTSQ